MHDHRSPLCRRLGAPSLKSIPEYSVWIEMRRRCRATGRHNSSSYSERGIKVCPEWEASFEQFLEDMGRKPSPRHSIERVDNDKGYEPGNCIWAMDLAQANNKRNNRRVFYRGKNMTLREALRTAGDVIEKSAARRRLELGWPVAKAVETPPNPLFQKRLGTSQS